MEPSTCSLVLLASGGESGEDGADGGGVDAGVSLRSRNFVLMDELFRTYMGMVDDHLSKNRAKNTLAVVSLTRREASQSI